MPEFVWRAARADGGSVEGRSAAPSLTQLLAQLRGQGLTPISAEAAQALGSAMAASQGTMLARLRWRRGNERVQRSDILLFSTELATMLKAGLALDGALRVLIAMSSRPALVTLLQGLLDDVKAGQPFSRALAKHPQHFSDFFVSMVRSGEASGQLGSVIERLVEHMERLRELRDNVLSATIYPSILLVVAVLSVIAMLGFVVPQFETLFKGMGDALPLPTRIIMLAGGTLRGYGLVLLAALVVLIWLGRLWWRTPAALQWRQRNLLRLPWLGTVLMRYELTLFARSLGTLLGNGVPLLSALRIATETVSNLRVRAALEGIPASVKSGGKMADAMASTGVFEPLALNLVRVGEETGRLGSMLLELARVFNREVETSIKRGLTLLEPLLILGLGLILAAIIVSLMLGILSVNDLAV
jgi:general secretion pathway protein F